MTEGFKDDAEYSAYHQVLADAQLVDADTARIVWCSAREYFTAQAELGRTEPVFRPFEFKLEEGSLSEIVYQALGAASMAWVGGTGNLEFDSARATEIGEKLIKAIEDRELRRELIDDGDDERGMCAEEATISHSDARFRELSLGYAVQLAAQGSIPLRGTGGGLFDDMTVTYSDPLVLAEAFRKFLIGESEEKK